MKNSSLKAALEQLGPIRAVSHSASGSKELVVLLRPDNTEINAIAATRVLASCGLSLLKAKRAIETVIENGRADLLLPKVESRDSLETMLIDAGIDPRITTPSPDVDVKAIREHLRMSQEQFSVAYGLEMRTIQNYEAGTRKPDAAALSYLTLIRSFPEKMKEALADAVQKTA